MKKLFSKLISPYLDYSAHIFKFMVNQVTMSALGLIVFAAYLLVKDILVAKILIALFPLAFFCFLIYDAMFEFGHKDSVEINYGNIKFEKLFGAKVFFLSYLPSLIVIIFNIIFTLCMVETPTAITAIIYYILNGFSLGMFSILGSVLPAFVSMILLCLPPFIACTLGYYLGAKDLPIRKILGIPIKNPEEKEKRK